MNVPQSRQWNGVKNSTPLPKVFLSMVLPKQNSDSEKNLLGEFFMQWNVELPRQVDSLRRKCSATICETPSLTPRGLE